MLEISKKYIHDKVVLVLVSINVFVTFMSSAIILLRLSSGQESTGYFVQYRPAMGISAFSTGSTLDIVSFIVFSILVLALVVFLSIRAYPMRKELAFVILGVGAFLLLVNSIISNGLLQLH